MAVEAALFDVFGTLVDWRRGIATAVAPVLAREGAEIEAEAFAEAWRGEYEPSMTPIREGRRPYAALDTLHRENLDRLLDRLGLGLGEDDRAALTRAWERLPPWADVPEGLARLRTRLLLAPCSNGSIALMARLARHAGFGWDAVLGAEIARTYKPRPEVYLASCAALGLVPASVVMVAAHNDDLRAARAQGLATAFVARTSEYGPDQTTDLGPEQDWDWVADDLGDLARQMAG
ncbi:MAG: haloacid dehalogenase type II [Paracoccaceae bacterium]